MFATVRLKINILFADKLRLLEMIAQVRRDNGIAVNDAVNDLVDILIGQQVVAGFARYVAVAGRAV